MGNVGPAQPGPQQATDELSKLPNVTPLAQAATIVQQMQQMQETQQQMQQQMRQMQQQMQQSEYNSIARLHNSGIGRSDAPLTPLRDFTTNADIQGFPATPAQLSEMSDPALDHVLTALNLPIDGTDEDKKGRLRFYVGLKDIR